MSIQITNIKDIASEFDNILNEFIIDKGIFIPLKKDTIKYKNYSIKKSLDGWDIFKFDKLIFRTFLKSSAFAFCKLHESDSYDQIKNLSKLDKDFKKHYIDSKFFQYTINSSSDEVTRDTSLWRYEISSKTALQLKKKINNLLYRLIV